MSLMFAATAGLFAQPALAFDHTHATFGAFLDGAVSEAGVDYAALKTRHDQLTAYLGEVANAPAASFTNDQKLAFYVNAYNALTINLILTENPKSIMDLNGGKVWDQRTFDVGRQRLTLNQIEHENARKLTDGRVHAVVNCASKGCPPLPPKPLLATTLQAQLDEAAKAWVRTNAYKMDGTVLQLNQIFKWYGDDFVSLPPGTASESDKQNAAKAFVTKFGGDVSAAKSVEWREYDWSLNRR